MGNSDERAIQGFWLAYELPRSLLRGGLSRVDRFRQGLRFPHKQSVVDQAAQLLGRFLGEGHAVVAVLGPQEHTLRQVARLQRAIEDVGDGVAHSRELFAGQGHPGPVEPEEVASSGHRPVDLPVFAGEQSCAIFEHGRLTW
jgi:hypothetical protein